LLHEQLIEFVRVAGLRNDLREFPELDLVVSVMSSIRDVACQEIVIELDGD
jgi:hypothetical protein